MKSVSQLETDVKWWEDEIRARERKVEEAKQTLKDRQRELEDAKRGEQREEEKKKSSTPKKY